MAKACHTCLKDVDETAVKCPHCGSRLGNSDSTGIAKIRRRSPWIWVGSIVGGGLLFSLPFVFMEPKSHSSTPSASDKPRNQVIVKFGEEIPCQINTAIDPSMNVGINEQIKNPHAFIDRQRGILTIRFDTSITIGIQNNILIRGFDRNGQYLFHFVTNEKFSTFDAPTTVPLRSFGNVIQYPINLQSAGYVGAIEFGLVALNR